MGEKDTILKEKLKYSGLGSFKDAYEYAYSFLVNEDYNIIEDSYKEAVKGEDKEIEIVWTASKKLTDYYKSILNLKWRILGMSDVEIETNGKKKKMNKFADFSIDIKGVLERDYEGKWADSAVQKFMRSVYEKYVDIKRKREMEGKVKDIVQDFKEEMKAFLELTGKR